MHPIDHFCSIEKLSNCPVVKALSELDIDYMGYEGLSATLTLLRLIPNFLDIVSYDVHIFGCY